MKPFPCLPATVLLFLLSGHGFAAKDGKPVKKTAAPPDGGAAEMFKTYDKNGNHQIDPDELAAMQKAFDGLRKLDKNGNGEIEQGEVVPPKAAAMHDRRAKAMAGIKKIDQNGNGKVDPDEIPALQKMLAGGRIMQRLDQNGDGKLQPSEVDRLNQRIQQHAGAAPKSTGLPPPAAKPEEKKPGDKKPEEPKFDGQKDPFEPPPAKTPVKPAV